MLPRSCSGKNGTSFPPTPFPHPHHEPPEHGAGLLDLTKIPSSLTLLTHSAVLPEQNKRNIVEAGIDSIGHGQLLRRLIETSWL